MPATNKPPEVNVDVLNNPKMVTDDTISQRQVEGLLGSGNVPAIPTATSGNVVAVVNQIRTAMIALGAATDGD